VAERKTVEGAYAKIESHERECTLRYEALGVSISELKDTVKGARRGAWTIAAGVIGWLALQVYEKLETPHVPEPVPAVVSVPLK